RFPCIPWPQLESADGAPGDDRAHHERTLCRGTAPALQRAAACDRRLGNRPERLLALTDARVWAALHTDGAARRKLVARAVSGRLPGLHEADQDAAALCALIRRTIANRPRDIRYDSPFECADPRWAKLSPRFRSGSAIDQG